MKKRKKVPKEMETEVLTRGRRRCCICYGLHHDPRVKSSGQIAHLDHDSSNNRLGNLAYLCLQHHDQYDSKTRQSKNLTIREVKKYRKELYDYVAKMKKPRFDQKPRSGRGTRQPVKVAKKRRASTPDFESLRRSIRLLPTVLGRDARYKQIFRLSLKHGQPAEALKTARLLSTALGRDDAYWQLFNYLTSRGMLQEAESVAGLLSTTIGRSRARQILLDRSIES